MKYYVVSEEELMKLRDTAIYDTFCGDGDYSDTDKAESACRAREVVASDDAPSGTLAKEVWVEEIKR